MSPLPTILLKYGERMTKRNRGRYSNTWSNFLAPLL